MTRWLLAALLAGVCWSGAAEAGGFLRGRVGSGVPGTYGPPVGTVLSGPHSTLPSAYAVPGSAAYPTGYVQPGTEYTRGYVTATTGAPTPELINANPPIRPYSYYVARPLGTARGYYGLGDDQFPYYGQPYGHPYDPWTWPYMTNASSSLYHYYYPPIP